VLSALVLIIGIQPAAAAPFTIDAFNIDYGTAFGTPSSAYGAAANQPGFWNNPLPGTTAPQQLRDLSGALTAVTIAMGNPQFEFSANHPLTVGDDKALMDDAVDLFGRATAFTIANLPAGTYDIYTYAWAPDDPAFRTGVNVNMSGGRLVGGAWTGSHVLGVTYALHQVTLAPGQNVIVVAQTVVGAGSINGFQIAQVPEPTTLVLSGLGMGLLTLVRRHRRLASRQTESD